MKKKTMLNLMIICGFFIPFFGQDAEEVIAEKVKVVNVEVPVRVFAAGKPVTDLNKEDFTILEDGKRQDINGFQIIRKKIAAPAETGAEVKPAEPSRYFVLVFRTYNFNDSLRKGLAYTFDKILRPQDRLLAFVNDFSQEYASLEDKEKVLLEIEQNLQDQCKILHDNMFAKLKEIDECVKSMRWEPRDGELPAIPGWESPAAPVWEFLRRYLELLREYKRQFLTQSVDRYYFFSRYLEKVGGEKWVIQFCQKEMLPRLKESSDIMRHIYDSISAFEAATSPGQMQDMSPTDFQLVKELPAYAIQLTQMLRDIELEANTGVGFPSEDVSKLFYKVNATFHSLLINTDIDTRSFDLEYKQISADGLEQSLRELSAKTGGTVISSTNVESSLAKLAEKEDSCYMLTYAPRGEVIGKIRVIVERKGCTVLYDDNQRADYIDKYLEKMAGAKSEVKIEGLSLAGKRLSLTLSGYTLAKLKDEITGFIGVHIRVKNDKRKDVYNGNKIYKAGSPSFGLSLDFPNLEPGRYDVVVDVIDQVGGILRTEFIQPLVQ